MTGVNDPLTAGDPVVAQVLTTSGTLPGPFAGESINCRSCHFVVEFQGLLGRATGRTRTLLITARCRCRWVISLRRHAIRCRWWVRRKSRTGPDISLFDGQFSDPADLVKSTLTGEIWLGTDADAAGHRAHQQKVIRADNGMNTPAQEYGENLPYSVIFLGTQPDSGGRAAGAAVPPGRDDGDRRPDR